MMAMLKQFLIQEFIKARIQSDPAKSHFKRFIINNKALKNQGFLFFRLSPD